STARVARLRAAIVDAELDALIIDGAANLRYLTGYTGSNGLALLAADGSARFLTDFRYASQIAEEVDRGFTAEIVSGDLFEALARGLTPGRVGFDDLTTTVRHRETVVEHAPQGVELVPASGRVEQLRAIKDDGEVAAIAAAAALIDEIY